MQHKTHNEVNSSATQRIRLANIKDELELYGWSALDIERGMRDALKVLDPQKVVELFDELVAEERAYYRIHAPLKDDQLDHTDLSA